jgi:hypothetical protein
MALAHELVKLMTDLIPEGGRQLERCTGSSALDVAREIEGVVMARLESNLGHVLLWEQFQRTPLDVGQALAGVLDKLMLEDPTLAAWLAESLCRYQREIGSQEGG